MRLYGCESSPFAYIRPSVRARGMTEGIRSSVMRFAIGCYGNSRNKTNAYFLITITLSEMYPTSVISPVLAIFTPTGVRFDG